MHILIILVIAFFIMPNEWLMFIAHVIGMTFGFVFIAFATPIALFTEPRRIPEMWKRWWKEVLSKD
jgi:hypothetical protein